MSVFSLGTILAMRGRNSKEQLLVRHCSINFCIVPFDTGLGMIQ